MSEQLISFPDCPNGCVNGKIYNPHRRLLTTCEYCEKKRRSLASGALEVENGVSLASKLKIPQRFSGMNFVSDTLIPNFARKYLEEDSVNEVVQKMDSMLTDVSIGDIPKNSIMFNLGKKADAYTFIYPYMMKAYVAGVSVSPLLTVSELIRVRAEYERNGFNRTEDDIDGFGYLDYLKTDVCIIMIDAGVMASGLDAVKGLMQLRANEDKSTIIFTNYWGSAIYDMCTEDGEECRMLATLCSVVYKPNGQVVGTALADGYSSADIHRDGNGAYRTGFSGNMSSQDFNSLLSANKKSL